MEYHLRSQVFGAVAVSERMLVAAAIRASAGNSYVCEKHTHAITMGFNGWVYTLIIMITPSSRGQIAALNVIFGVSIDCRLQIDYRGAFPFCVINR